MARIGNINYDGNDQRFKAIKDLLNSIELQEIEANPSDTPTESLESLRIDEEVYNLGGGTVVIANPSGTPTDELNSIQIGNDIYEITGGGSGGGGKYTVTTLNTDTITAAGEVTLADSITKFDDILVIVKSNSNGASIPYTINVDYLINNCPYSTNINDRHILFSMYGTEYIRMMAGTDTNKLYFHQFSTESVAGIYGIKYGSGGSGGGSKYSEEVLWDYATDNSGTIPYGLITITLPKSIDQFDAISVELISSSGDSGNWEGTCYFSISVNALNNTRTKGRINYTSFDQRSSNFYISGTTFQKVANNVNNTNGLIKIIGVNYGSGGGSGASSVSELTDVELDNLSDGQILKYDATNEKWVNADGSGGGSGDSYEETELYTGTTIVTNVTLSESFKIFDALSVRYGFTYSGRTYYVNNIITKTTLEEALPNSNWITLGYTSDAYVFGQLTSETTFAQVYGKGYLFGIYGVKYGSGGGGNTNKYSTDETVVGEWIDGKPIYRLVFMPWKNGVLQSGYTYSNYILTDSPFKNVNAELVTNVRVINIRAGSDGYIDVNGSGITSQSGTGNDTIVPNTDGTIFVRISNPSSNNKTVYIILEYTKTTD